MSEQKPKGLFITFEGGEGAGKTTQINALKDFLRSKNKEILCTREPGGSHVAEAMRDLFVTYKGNEWPVMTQALQMFAARSHHIETVIKPALNKGKIVICDRFTDSTLAYQGYAGGMSLDILSEMNRIATDNFTPDMTFLLDIAPKEGLSRANDRGNENGEDTFERETIDFHTAIRNGFLDIAGKNKERCHVIDASQPVEDIKSVIQAIVLSAFDQI